MALPKKAANPKLPAKPAKKNAEKTTPAKKASDKKIAPKAAAPARKAPVKASSKPAARPLISASQKALLARLTEAVPQLDEECLEALVHSAENLAESCRQDSMLEEARAAAFDLMHGTKKGSSSKALSVKAGRKKKGQADDASPMKTAIGMPAPLTVEVSEDKRFFHIVVDGKWKMLDMGELKILVRIASDKGSESSLMTRMFTWLKRERSDVLNDLGISSTVSPILAELIAYLKKNFKVMP